jgi:aryl-alcohol dehydrogenase-like predicted oxidoreductase
MLYRAGELVDLIDTAYAYGPGVSNRLIGTSLAPYDDVGVATKGGQLRNSDGD